MKKLNKDGTLKGYEFSEGYDPEAPPVFTRIPEGEDLIDFPCSPAFIRHFANQGLTADYPKEFYLDKETEPTGEVTNKDSIISGWGGRGGLLRGGDFVKRGEFLFWQAKIIKLLEKKEKYTIGE